MTISVRFCLSYDCFKQSFITLKVELTSVENRMLSGTASWCYAPVTKSYEMCSHRIFVKWCNTTKYQRCHMIKIIKDRVRERFVASLNDYGIKFLEHLFCGIQFWYWWDTCSSNFCHVPVLGCQALIGYTLLIFMCLSKDILVWALLCNFPPSCICHMLYPQIFAMWFQCLKLITSFF